MPIENLLNQYSRSLYRKNLHSNNSIFIAKEINGLPRNELFPRSVSHPTIPNIALISKLNVTDNPSEADYILVPHSWRNILNNRDYLRYLNELSENTPVLIVNSGDVSPRCTLKNKLELRTFLHPWESSDYKIVLPYPVKKKQFIIRKWKPIPRISFIGYIPKIGFGSLFGENIQGILKPIKSSVYLNRKIASLRLKSLSPKFEVLFKPRLTFTAFASNPDGQKHMSEYDKELSISDYILCPRGFGNTSIRFFETICSGATPILIDSSGQFPKIADNKFWENNVLKVGLFKNWERSILRDWANLGIGDNYNLRQFQNNKTFIEQLNFETYLEKLFDQYLK
jgi:hypothetical protein